MALVPTSNFTQVRDGVRRFASGFTRGQKAVTLAAVGVVVVVGGIFMSISGKPTYSILFTNLQASDAASITQQLASDHVPYQLQDGGSTILVPENDVDQERLAAAQAGLPADSTVGLSLLDKEGLTTSELTQQADYLRALQGELEQTIDSISGVQGSQVNVAMAANQTFVLGNTNPTGAAVLVDLAPNHDLSYSQVQAITSLVSSTVPGLAASAVTVADSNGDLLAGPGVSDTGGAQTNAQAAYDDATTAKVMAYLSGVLGPSNADVQVAAQLDFDQVQTNTNTLIDGKNGQPLTACTSTSSTSTKYTGSGTPPGSSISTASSGSGNYTQTQKQDTCETGSETSTVTQAPGTVKQQSVAVLVNSRAIPKGMSLSVLHQGVAAAAGIVASRGDVLSFNSAPFAVPAVQTPVKASPLTTFAKPGLAFVLVVLALVLLLLASRRARKRPPVAEPSLDGLGFEQYYGMPQELPTGEIPAIGQLGPSRTITSLQSIVDNQPEEVAQVLTGWLGGAQPMIPLTMAQKAAVILVQLDDPRANAVLRNMSEAEVTLLMAEVARLPPMTEEMVGGVIAELGNEAGALLQVRQGGRDIAARLLRDRLGLARAEEILADFDRVVIDHPLAFLNQIDPNQVVGYISEEHPQTIAIVIVHLEPDKAARMMERLGDSLRAEVARRVAKMQALPPDVVRRIAAELEPRLASFVRGGVAANQEVGGIQTMVGILNNTDRATEKRILADLDENDPELAEAIRNEMFVFDDLLEIPDPDLQLILRNVPVMTIAVALKGKDPAILERFKSNLSQRNAMDLQEDFDTLGAQRASLVEHAEAEIIRQARTLAESGEINIERGDDELVA